MAHPFFYVVYKTTNLKTGEFYIGCHKTRFADDEYLGSGVRIRKAIREHGKENFKKEVLFSSALRTPAHDKEKELIRQALASPLCYNVRAGGEGGHEMRACMAPCPLPVQRALLKLGEDIKNARKRRRLPIEIVAQRGSLSRTTVARIEQGNPGVALGAFATVLFVLGMLDRIDASVDEVGRTLQDEQLPERVRLKPWERSEIAAHMSKL